MFDLRKYVGLAVAISLMLTVSACGPSNIQDSVISTAVAQTVQAGESQTDVANLPTLTPQALSTDALPAPATTPTSAPTLASAPADPNCAKALLVSEDPPDGKIFRPGEYFWKTWTFQNIGTCTWNTSYQLIFWSGDLMDGLTAYYLDDEVAPNEQKSISIYLKAPDTIGTFTGYWRLATPWNSNFGVGPGDDSFYVSVATSTDKRPDYGVSSVTYSVVREPATECPRNVKYTVYATISTNGPYEFNYRWIQSDGNSTSAPKPLVFTEAGSKTLNREWMVGRGDSPKPKWMQIVVTDPDYQEFDKVEIPDNCP
jgi:hypothetical protein